MKQPLPKHKFRSILLLGVTLLLSACISEKKPLTTLQKTNVSAAVVPNSTPDPDWTDPLFFIEGQLCQHLRKIFQDRSGNLWFGTNVYDLMRYDGDTLTYLTEKDGIGGGRVTGILEDSSGVVWFGMFDGLSKFDPTTERFSNYPLASEALEHGVWSMALDRKNRFWIGTAEGLFLFDGKTFSPFPLPKAAVKNPTPILSTDRITAILEDRQGTLWFGTDGYGIWTYDGTHFTHLTDERELTDNHISELMEDSQGNIWIGTMFGGISRFDGTTFTHFTQDGVVKGVEVGGFFEDRKGNVWFAAENQGVYRYDPSAPDPFTLFTSEQGLNTNGILSIYEDHQNRFWLGGWGGLFRFDGKTFVSVTKAGPWEK